MRSTRFEAEIRAASEDALILLGADFSQIHDKIRNARIDLMLGTSNGRQISKKREYLWCGWGFPTTIEWEQRGSSWLGTRVPPGLRMP